MKPVLTLSLIFSTLTAFPQFSTFNLGWKSRPQQVLAGGETSIVSIDVSPGHITGKTIAKFKRTFTGYELIGRIGVPDTIIDYSFHNGLLNLICINRWECDYGPNNTHFIQIDTAQMTKIKSVFLGPANPHRQINFASDSTLFLMGDFITPSYFADLNLNNIDSVHTVISQPYHANVLLNGNYILQQSPWDMMLLHLLRHDPQWIVFPTPDTTYYPYVAIANKTFPEIRASFGFGTDSILFVTDNRIYKTDTGLRQFPDHPLPAHKRFIFNDTTYSLVHDKKISHYKVSNHSLLSTDSLQAPARVSLAHAHYSPSDTIYLTYSSHSTALNETILSSRLQLNAATGLDLQFDSLIVDTIIFIPGNSVYNRRVYYSVIASNSGTDPIEGFLLLYNDHPKYSMCSHYHTKYIDTLIPPNASIELKGSVPIWDKASVCLYGSVPNNELEPDLTNNRTCLQIPIGLEQISDMVTGVYPNPASEILAVKGLEDIRDVTIIDIIGRTHPVEQTTLHNNEWQLNISSLPGGIYFVKIISGNGTSHACKLLVER